MIDKLQNFMKWASEQVFKTNPPKTQHMDHMNKLPSGTQITVVVPEQKPKRKYTRRKPNVTH
jgi:hypothetical protein